MPNQIDVRKLARLLSAGAPAPGTDEESAQYGFPGQGDAYDNPLNPNYWANEDDMGNMDRMQRDAISMPDAAYQPGKAALTAGPGAANDAIRKISEAVMLSQQRPIWGQDYLGPQTGGEMDAVSYQASPYEQGRSIPPDVYQGMTPEQDEVYGGDMGMQELAGMDPYGNPLPPTWARPPTYPYKNRPPYDVQSPAAFRAEQVGK